MSEGTKRKPHNKLDGYVCERKHPCGGWLVLLDRNNGGDWIDADNRWVLLRIDANNSSQGTCSCPSKAGAYNIINAECREGKSIVDW